MTALESFLSNLEKLSDAATPGPWYVDCGVSQRSGWAIRQWIKGSQGERNVLWLNSSDNIKLDEETNEVEANQDFITEARLAIPMLIRIIRKQNAALRWYADESNYCGTDGDPYQGTIPGQRVQCGHPLDPPDYDWDPDCGETASKATEEIEKLLDESLSEGK